jgi:predicted dehydrogenase
MTAPASSPKRFKLGFIGTGGRSVAYAEQYATSDEIEITALADPNAATRKAMIAQAKLSGTPAEYDDWRDLHAHHPDLDGVVICSPNHLHADHAVPFLERGLPIALEKPLATTQGDCERILDAERASGGRTLLGFVLRSAPFYKAIHALVRANAVGAVCSIEAHEHVRWTTSSLFMRSAWRRLQRTSGGAMLEKCCHDIDILNWMVGCRPVSLNSYGNRLMFNPNPSLPESCDTCKVGGDCNYYHTPRNDALGEAGDKRLHRFLADGGACVYNTEKDITDVQTVNIEYENGAVANFLMALNVGGSRGSRNLAINGTQGCVWGDIDRMKVAAYDNRTDKETEHAIVTDGSGHGGGDKGHAFELLRMMQDRTYVPGQNAKAGYLSAMMCLAADVSRLERRRINFRYGSNDYIQLA